MARVIRWLHLSDLHYGCAGKALWKQVERDFFDDLARRVEKVGLPDLILFTGDLANKGEKEEYDEVDAFLDKLGERLGPEPLLVAVPGNHDVVRPEGRDNTRAYRILRSLDGTLDDPEVQDLYEELWEDQNASLINGLFPTYRTWFERRIRPRLEREAKAIHFSHFPCDFTAVVEPAGAFPLTLVGVNSTWLQYTGGDFETKLLVPIEQLNAALPPDDPFGVVGPDRQALLLMHQPPSWLSEQGEKIFNRDIYPGGRFSLCLQGHLHVAESHRGGSFGGQERCFLQGASLFGVTDWGKSGEERRMGYSLGEMTDDGWIRVWPREWKVRGSGSPSFGFDGDFHADKDDPEAAVLRYPAPPQKTPRLPRAASKRDADEELGAYLRELRESVTYLDFKGLAADDRDRQRLVRPLLDQLYVPLRGRDEGSLDALMGRRSEDVRRPLLEEQLSRGTRVLIEGPAGSGKSTFLRRVTSLLVRPALGERVDERPSRNVRRLGIGTPIPVLLRLEALGRVLSGASKPADRERLLDLLALDCGAKEAGFDRSAWRHRLESGRVCLLLDGLDEVTADEQRQGVLSILSDAAAHWQARIVVASRPFLTEGLTGAGFLKLEVAAFDDDDLRTFLDLWVAMLAKEDPEKAKTAASKAYRRKLEEAILRPDIRVLAKSPMMLTCLCLVHWSRGELPKGRARVYQAVIRWLLEARRESRQQRFGLSEAGAYEALADLALWALEHEQGKQVSFALDAAAEVVAPAFERILPDLKAAGLQKKARQWLGFEASLSGVLEELPGNRLRFGHLTFGEYLAAWRLAQLPEGQDWWSTIEPRLADVQWRETVELFASCLQLHSHVSYVDRLLKQVLGKRRPGDLAENARVMAILGRLLPALEIYEYQPAASVREAQESLRQEVMAIFEKAGASRVAIADRIAAAEALGQGGDPRLQEENFLAVPGTQIHLGKYPVTVEEYKDFVEGRGYEDARWWGEGWSVRQEAKWESPGSWAEQLLTPNRPVVEVSWFEAMAYCRWLSDQRVGEFRLPTEAEWEAAATHPSGEYPWGSEEPNEELANFAREFGKGNVGRPTPVGVYPRGAGRYGHLDLGGNVLEWCLDDQDEFRPLRGGCWWFDASFLRSAFRFRLEPGDRDVSFGFRLSWSPSSTVS